MPRLLLLHGTCLVTIMAAALALDNGLAKTPPMGWRSWNCYHGDVNDTVIRATVDAVAAKSRSVNGKMMSLVDLGFVHVGVDDGWQACGMGRVLNNRSSFHAMDGTPLVNKSTFPDLKAMVAYGHSKGAKMGWYENNCICMDSYTVAQDMAWANRTFEGDVKQLLDAEFDSVKIDNCGDDQAKGFTARMEHIEASGKAILVENSNQGFGNPQRGQCHGNMQCPGPNCRGNPNNTVAPGWCPYNLFRTGGDIGPDFEGVMAKLQATIPYQDLKNPISRPGCWAYPDMLEVGNFNEANSTLGFIESRSHFGGWCIVSAPLIIGMDVTDKAKLDGVWPILNNMEAIAVNQAWAGHPGRLVSEGGPNDPAPAGPKAYQVWAKPMPGGGQAVYVVNRSNKPVTLAVNLASVGLVGTVRARDVWNQKDLGSISGTFPIPSLGVHDSVLVRFSSNNA